jgi:uncharacterized repeat protein (TIGR03803 family)
LILVGNTLYGTTAMGGNSDSGTVFAVRTNGTSFTNLHRFTPLPSTLSGTNSDGAKPSAALILSGNALYGTTSQGGKSGGGTVFQINTNGTGFTNLHSFAAISVAYSPNSGGAQPSAGLILSDNTLYGTTFYGGTSGYGTIFKIRINGTAFTNLYNFPAVSPGTFATNSTGTDPYAGLIISGNSLYGTTHYGGTSGYGAVFQVNTDGTGFKNLHSFTGGSGGGYPFAGLILSGLTLYGTTGSSGNTGTVFSISFPPPRLTIAPSGANVVLTWPTSPFGFSLQSTTNLVPAAVWSTVSPEPIIFNGQNLVINPASGTQQFYRLSQ